MKVSSTMEDAAGRAPISILQTENFGIGHKWGALLGIHAVFVLVAGAAATLGWGGGSELSARKRGTCGSHASLHDSTFASD